MNEKETRPEGLTLEQMEAALYLLATDGTDCFCWFPKSGGPFYVLDLEFKGQGDVTQDSYSIGFNLNDCFHWATADTEVIPWGEIVAVRRALAETPRDDRFWWILDWAAQKRGHEPEFADYREKMAEFRARRDAAKA
jgi:hypothetical protein